MPNETTSRHAIHIGAAVSSRDSIKDRLEMPEPSVQDVGDVLNAFANALEALNDGLQMVILDQQIANEKWNAVMRYIDGYDESDAKEVAPRAATKMENVIDFQEMVKCNREQ